MKKVLCLLLTILCLFLIYNTFSQKNIHYVSINNGLSYDYYIEKYLLDSKKNYYFNNLFGQKSIVGLTKDIQNNRTIWNNDGEVFLKKTLRESDVLVINVGMDELAEKYQEHHMNLNYYYFNKMYLNIEILIKEINKYAKGKILFIGYYNPTNYYDSKTDEFFYHVNLKLNRLMTNNGISYIDVYKLFKENKYKDSEIINEKGLKTLANIIEFYL